MALAVALYFFTFKWVRMEAGFYASSYQGMLMFVIPSFIIFFGLVGSEISNILKNKSLTSNAWYSKWYFIIFITLFFVFFDELSNYKRTESFVVPHDLLYPQIRKGDFIIVDKEFYSANKFIQQSGDVIAVQYDKDNKIRLKRFMKFSSDGNSAIVQNLGGTEEINLLETSLIGKATYIYWPLKNIRNL